MASMFEKVFGVRRARASVDSSARESANEAEHLKNQGNERLADGDAAGAAECYRAALTVSPEYAEGHNNLGFALVRLGQAAEAERHYRQALAFKPGLAPAHFNLGVLCQEQGRNATAIEYFTQALATAPAYLDAYIRLGGLLYEQGRFGEAVEHFERALGAGLNLPVIHHDLGIFQRELRRYLEAECSFRQALALEPGNATAHYEIGLLCMRAERYDEAIASFRCAGELRPDYAEAHVNLGNVLMKQERHDEAVRAYRAALDCRSDMAEAHNGLGLVWKDLRRFDDAEAALRRAIAVRPDVVGFARNLGLVYRMAGRYEEAEQVYRDILARHPGDHEVYDELACVYGELHRFDESEAACRRALALVPDYVEARRNLTYLLLSVGRYAEGWPLHEVRYDREIKDKKVVVATPKFPFPQWQGEPLAGKSILVWLEQGFGDEIQFARYMVLLKELGAVRVALVCTRPLRALFESLAGVDTLYVAEPATRYPAFDYWVMLMSLPLHCGTTPETIPASLPYLEPPQQRLAEWRDRLPQQGLRVGLVWKGNPKHTNNHNRSLPGLATMAPLWAVPGVSFVSLQKGEGEDEAKASAMGQPLLELGSATRDFADTAVIIAQLDLVICVDTAVAHLAGALNKPCWVMLPWVGTDWRWLQDRDDSPWYPGVMRLFRQPASSDWTPVVDEVASALRAFVAAQDRAQ